MWPQGRRRARASFLSLCRGFGARETLRTREVLAIMGAYPNDIRIGAFGARVAQDADRAGARHLHVRLGAFGKAALVGGLAGNDDGEVDDRVVAAARIAVEAVERAALALAGLEGRAEAALVAQRVRMRLLLHGDGAVGKLVVDAVRLRPGRSEEPACERDPFDHRAKDLTWRSSPGTSLRRRRRGAKPDRARYPGRGSRRCSRRNAPRCPSS